ncbi:uncharacterized protein LOC121380655 [Gigantopelta aegis]|uniref:uncharacterized protein LOC121380655 n=1 Tax=Gigantopelta aegis TaxID=1735272 RepID=UPI001B88A9EE|nr:uncharacterized protein LOC121380655 [Gigantopelta aegis]
MKQLQLKMKCHYHCTSGVEILYHLVCFNTDIVEELKMKFIRQFGNEFPSVWDESVEINFSYHTRVLTNDEYFLLDGEPGRNEPVLSVARLGDLTIHVTSKDNRPVCVTFTESGKRTVKKVIVTEKSATTEDLRLVIGNHFKQLPNSLKLRLNLKKKKIPDDMVLEKIDGFLPNCHIFAEASDKTTFTIKISREGKSSTRIVEMYKYDKVSQLRDLLATSEKTNVFSVQLCYSGKEMDDDKRLKIYHIDQEDTIKMEIFNNRIEVRIRCLGVPPVTVVINNACETTILDLKSSLSTKIGIAVSEINIIFDATSLNNGDTLVDAGIHSSNIVIVRRFSPPERKYVDGVQHDCINTNLTLHWILCDPLQSFDLYDWILGDTELILNYSQLIKTLQHHFNSRWLPQ